MKKISILIVAILFASFLFVANENSWVKLNEKIYIKINYIQKPDNVFLCGWFREYEENITSYEEVKYCALCDESKYLNIVRYKKYQNNTLIFDEINTHDVSADYSAYVNGEIYYNAICNNKKH